MTLTFDDYRDTYWNGCGKYEEDYNYLHKLVPFEGNSDQFHVEWLRAIGNIYYDFYNNGWCNWGVRRDDRLLIAKTFNADWLSGRQPESTKEVVDKLEQLANLIIVAVKAIENELNPLPTELDI